MEGEREKEREGGSERGRKREGDGERDAFKRDMPLDRGSDFRKRETPLTRWSVSERRGKNLKEWLTESQGHNLALTVVFVPNSLDSGRGKADETSEVR